MPFSPHNGVGVHMRVIHVCVCVINGERRKLYHMHSLEIKLEGPCEQNYTFLHKERVYYKSSSNLTS